MNDVLAVTGAGGMGRAIAARLGPGGTVVLGDVDPGALASARDELTAGGIDVVTVPLDTGDAASVRRFAAEAARHGPVRRLAHTAGVSPEQAPVERILRVDLVGTVRVLDAFGPVMARGGAGLVVASLIGHLRLVRMPADHEQALATMSADDLAEVAWAGPAAFDDPQTAYGFAKQANLLRVRSAALAWGDRGVRLNSVSPGIVTTPMGELELRGPFGDHIRKLADTSPAGRMGTADDVARAADFLLGPDASYVTGTDLLLDGGVLAAMGTGRRG